MTWIPRGNRGFPIQSFRVEYKKVKKAGEDWATAVENIPPSRLSVEITGLEKGQSAFPECAVLGCAGVLRGRMDGKKKNENCRNCLRCELGNYSVITAPPPVNLSV